MALDDPRRGVWPRERSTRARAWRFRRIPSRRCRVPRLRVSRCSRPNATAIHSRDPHSRRLRTSATSSSRDATNARSRPRDSAGGARGHASERVVSVFFYRPRFEVFEAGNPLLTDIWGRRTARARACDPTSRARRREHRPNTSITSIVPATRTRVARERPPRLPSRTEFRRNCARSANRTQRPHRRERRDVFLESLAH